MRKASRAARDDARRPVVLPAVSDRFKVGARQDGRKGGIRAVHAGKDVPDRIDPGLKDDLHGPFLKVGAGCLVFLGVGESGDALAQARVEGGESLDVTQDPLSLRPGQVHASVPEKLIVCDTLSMKAR
jgi:hypothetical protein